MGHWHSMVGLLAAAVAVAPAAAAVAEDAVTAPYRQDLYELGYTVFLANNNPADALKVAERALQAVPGARVWLLKAAQAADWSNQPAKALDYWFALAPHDPAAAGRATQLARGLQDAERLKLLLGQQLARQGGVELLKEYIAASEAVGQPEEALQVLEHPPTGLPEELVLTERVRLYEQTGRPREALATLERLATLRPLKTTEALQGATLWYGIGEPEQAWELLLRPAQAAEADDTPYWQAVTDLGWTLGYQEQAVSAAELLVKQGSGRIEDYQRATDNRLQRDPVHSYRLAREGWERHRQPIFAVFLLELGGRLERWRELYDFLGSLESEERHLLGGNVLFLQHAALVARRSGDINASLRYSRASLQLAPDNPAVAAAHIWLLLELGQVREAVQTAEACLSDAGSAPLLADALAAAFAAAGDHQRALSLYRLGFKAHRNDPAWLASYAGLLDQAGKAEGAYLARLMAAQLVREQRGSAMGAVEQQGLDRLTAQLALSLKPGDGLDRLMHRVARAPEDRVARDLVTGWLLATQRHELARLWYFKAYARLLDLPVWTSLSLAMAEDDQEALASLVEGSWEQLPQRDAVEAARRVGQLLRAESAAFERLEQYPDDQLLDTKLRGLLNQQRSQVGYGLSLLEQDGVGILENSLVTGLRLDNRWTAQFTWFDLRLTSVASDVVVNPPDSANGFVVGLTRRHQQGALTMLAGTTKAVARFWNAGLKAEQQLAAQVSANVDLRLGARAEENIPLRIAGIKDEAQAGLSLAVSPRTSVGLHGLFAVLRDQERRSLAQGGGGDIDVTHRVASCWPDFGVRLFGGYHTYQRTALPEGRFLAMVPANGDPGSFFVPQRYGQLGTGVFWGQDWKTDYSRDWKTFGSIDTSWNSATGAGFQYELGLVGPLLGLDSLLFSLSQGSGSFGNSAVTTRFSMSYRYYF